ncbi:hypothetical protein BT96DRAFT_938988 [Gymnopus androsaceus JB14]|uniref:Uncharacterized protein n=1 Tax=Gymnopus androsaceus JB14 TaxID=1447944 RepID=A0A6A4HQE4_9AGAR|nr:hypothetical protein BT96DRAFT_938988 [Gymnopus androsaceus JB14]
MIPALSDWGSNFRTRSNIEWSGVRSEEDEGPSQDIIRVVHRNQTRFNSPRSLSLYQHLIPVIPIFQVRVAVCRAIGRSSIEVERKCRQAESGRLAIKRAKNVGKARGLTAANFKVVDLTIIMNYPGPSQYAYGPPPNAYAYDPRLYGERRNPFLEVVETELVLDAIF